MVQESADLFTALGISLVFLAVSKLAEYFDAANGAMPSETLVL
jgi:hypothetical protein